MATSLGRDWQHGKVVDKQWDNNSFSDMDSRQVLSVVNVTYTKTEISVR